jgi:hypothetical protein
MNVSTPPGRRTGIRAAYQALMLATVAALLLGACSSGGTPASQGVKNGGILRVGMTQTIDNLNPFVGFEQVSYDIWETIYPSWISTTPRRWPSNRTSPPAGRPLLMGVPGRSIPGPTRNGPTANR